MKQRGFTLVEVIVVILVISLLLGAVVLPLGNFKERWLLKHEAEVLHGKLQALRAEAVMRHLQLGFFVSQRGYRFVVLDTAHGGWVDFNKAPFEPTLLPESVGLSTEPAPDAPSGPPVIFYSTGEMNLPIIRLHAADAAAMQAVIRSSAEGTIVLENTAEK